MEQAVPGTHRIRGEFPFRTEKRDPTARRPEDGSAPDGQRTGEEPVRGRRGAAGHGPNAHLSSTADGGRVKVFPGPLPPPGPRGPGNTRGSVATPPGVRCAAPSRAVGGPA